MSQMYAGQKPDLSQEKQGKLVPCQQMHGEPGSLSQTKMVKFFMKHITGNNSEVKCCKTNHTTHYIHAIFFDKTHPILVHHMKN